MREYLFRGKRTDTGEWVLGDLMRKPSGQCFIHVSPAWHEVFPDSVGEFALTNENGIKIFEGDLFRETIEDDLTSYERTLAVMWIKQRGAFYLVDTAHIPVLEDNDCEKEPEFSWLFDDAALYDFSIDTGLPLIGNIHEHKHKIL